MGVQFRASDAPGWRLSERVPAGLGQGAPGLQRQHPQVVNARSSGQGVGVLTGEVGRTKCKCSALFIWVALQLC